MIKREDRNRARVLTRMILMTKPNLDQLNWLIQLLSEVYIQRLTEKNKRYEKN